MPDAHVEYLHHLFGKKLFQSFYIISENFNDKIDFESQYTF